MGLSMSPVIWSGQCPHTLSAISVKGKASGRRDLNASRWKLHKKLVLWYSPYFLILFLGAVSLFMLAVKMGAADATVGSLPPSGLCRSLNNWWNMYLSPSGVVQSLFGLRQLSVRWAPCPTCLSVSLSVVSAAQPDRQGRRSSTFTLPPCETSRGVLMNEVAISYCSVKRVLKCVCVYVPERERKVGKRQDRVATEERWIRKRTERRIRSVAAAPLIVQVLFMWRFSRKYLEQRRRMGEKRRVGGQRWGPGGGV